MSEFDRLAKNLRAKLCMDDTCKFDNGCGCLEAIKTAFLDLVPPTSVVVPREPTEEDIDRGVKTYVENRSDGPELSREALRERIRAILITSVALLANPKDTEG